MKRKLIGLRIKDEVSQKELKSTLSSFIKDASEEKLRLALKILRAVVR